MYEAKVLELNDVILSDGSTRFIRLLRKVITPTRSAVGIEFGTNIDELTASTKDPERVFPFDTRHGGSFDAMFFWIPEQPLISIVLLASGERWSKRYRFELNQATGHTHIFHQDHLDRNTEPNFKERGGTYMQSGV
jgi:hypothetical protein